MDQPDISEKTSQPRRRWLAALLSLFLPGLGQLYAGKPRWACFWFLQPILGLILLGLLHFYPVTRTIFIGFQILVLVQLVAVVDAWRQAARQQTYQLRRFNRWWIYLGIFLAPQIVGYLTGITRMPTGDLVQSFSVPAKSMTPTVIPGDLILADTYGPRLADIKRGDVVLFWVDGTVFIKRVVGQPGDVIAMSDGILTINDQVLPHDHERSVQDARISSAEADGATAFQETWPDGRKVIVLQRSTDGPRDFFPSLTVPADSFFVLGDNRNNSRDSRDMGMIHRDRLLGKARFIWWSKDFDRIGVPLN